MSTSFPVRTRPPPPLRPLEAESNPTPPRESVGSVGRSILLVVAAISVIGTSNYFAYMIGRKQSTYEELRRQVERVVQLVDQKQLDEERVPTTVKPRQDRLEQKSSGLAGLTTSTVNGKTAVVSPDPPAEGPKPAAAIDTVTVAPPHPEVRQPPEITNAIHRDVQRSPRRLKVPRRAATDAFAEHAAQSAPVPTPDVGLNGQ